MTLALVLGGRTVAELQAAMSPVEFDRWKDYHRDFPYDDRHRFHRPAALIATSMRGGGQDGLSDCLEWLQPRQKAPGREDLTESDRDLYAALGIKL